MKRMVLALLLAVASPAFGQGERSMEDMLEWSRGQVRQAERELNEARQKILEEKVPRIQELDELRAEHSRLAAALERSNAAKERDNARLGQVEKDAFDAESDARLLTNMLLQFRRDFDASLALVDRERLEEDFLAIERLAADQSSKGVADASWQLVQEAVSHLGGRLGGNRYDGKILIDGVEESGRFLAFGPHTFFRSEVSGTVGVVKEGDDLRMRLVRIDGFKPAAFDAVANGGEGAFPIDPMVDEAIRIEESKVSLAQHLVNGGYWMIPILGFGLLSYALALWKFAEVFGKRRPRKEQLDAVLEQANRSDVEAQGALAKLPASLRRVFEEGLQNARRPLETREAAMRRPFLEYRHKLDSKLSLIALTAAVAPLLGLLGTVTGMIKTFQLISIYGTGDAKSLSSGISEALVTTEFGLIVAIPALVAHAVLSRHARRQASMVTSSIDAFNHSIVEKS